MVAIFEEVRDCLRMISGMVYWEKRGSAWDDWVLNWEGKSSVELCSVDC